MAIITGQNWMNHSADQVPRGLERSLMLSDIRVQILPGSIDNVNFFGFKSQRCLSD